MRVVVRGTRLYRQNITNIIRMTFDNRDAVAESGMVATFISVHAHEAAHKLQSPRVFDCGMVDYLGLMFSQQSTEDEFLAQLLAVLAGQRERTAISADCLTLGPSCADAAVIDMMGDAEHLRARRAWFIRRLNEFTSRGDR
jgi:hypothetical protein